METDFSSWRVLVVDDEPDNLELITELLEFRGVDVRQATGGSQALEMIGNVNPNLILLDLSMPEMDGWELHQRLRKRPEYDDVPIVAVTALAMVSDAERGKVAGFDGYITKPYRIQSLMEQLVSCMDSFKGNAAS